MMLISLILAFTFALPSHFEAAWTQVRHSPLLTEDLVSSGTVVLDEPSYLRWETVEPVQSVAEFTGESRGRFKMPSEKDFKVIEDGEHVVLVPLRRDLKQMFRRIVVSFDAAGRVTSVFMEGTDDGWTKIDFKDIK